MWRARRSSITHREKAKILIIMSKEGFDELLGCIKNSISKKHYNISSHARNEMSLKEDDICKSPITKVTGI